jgi:prophage regulatory protein
MAQTGLGRSTIYAQISEGLWPKPVSLGARAVGWPSYEVSALTAARIQGQADGDIRALVTELETARRFAGTSRGRDRVAARSDSRVV